MNRSCVQVQAAGQNKWWHAPGRFVDSSQQTQNTDSLIVSAAVGSKGQEEESAGKEQKDSEDEIHLNADSEDVVFGKALSAEGEERPIDQKRLCLGGRLFLK